MTTLAQDTVMHRLRNAGIILVCGIVSVGCSTDLTALNNNPNNPTSATANSLFTNATVSAVQRFNDSFQTLSMTSLFAQHIAQVQYVEEDRGHIRPETIDFLFAGVYSRELKDLAKIIESNTATTAPNTYGPAVVMQSWVYQNITDLWGDIPYTEALQGDIEGGPLQPTYDKQQDIYAGVLSELTKATAAMKTDGSGDAGIGAADPIYHGDVAQWQRFSNSLRARMALRMHLADAAKANAELAAALAAPGGVFTSNADNAAMAWPGDGVFDNPLATNFSTRDDHRVSKTLLDTMLALSDPRTPIYAQPTVDDPMRYAGLQNGLDNATVSEFFNSTSRPGEMFYPGATAYGTFGSAAGKSVPSLLMTYAEVEFILAEAAERGMAGVTGAAMHYANGVRASIQQWGGSSADANAYLARAGVAYVSGAGGLRQIGLQKWIALYMQGAEAWSEWRRTGNPTSIRMGPSAYPDVLEVPRRLPYPSNEQSVNAVSLAAAIARQGPDTYATRVWWDKR